MDEFRVIQWATGNVGKAAIRHFAENPIFKLVGALVTDPAKAGLDAGLIAGTKPIGVMATLDPEEIVKLEAECVHYAPRHFDIDMVCRLLASGKNVVSPMLFHYPTEYFSDRLERIEAACREGGTSYHGSGIHPGFAGDLLPLVLARLSHRIDCIHLREFADLSNKHEAWPKAFGFGGDPVEVARRPGRSPESLRAFEQSMAMVVDGLDGSIEKVTSRFEVATATQDLDPPFGPVLAGSVAGMHFEWTAHADGRPLLVYHSYWTLGRAIDPYWGPANNRYEIEIEGEPPLKAVIEANGPHPDGDKGKWGLVWTAMAGVNAIPAVCYAEPGIVTHLDLGLLLPRGLVRA